MEFTILRSGSDGNCVILSTKKTSIMVDMGMSATEMEKRFDKANDEYGLDKLVNIKATSKTSGITNVSALFISHDHSDHSSGAGVFCRKYGVPMYISKFALEKDLKKDEAKRKFKNTDINVLEAGKEYVFDDIKIIPFRSWHDEWETFGFQVYENDVPKLAYLTDCGFISNSIKEKFIGFPNIGLEFNYDWKMMLHGETQWNKERTLGKRGHMCNEEASKFIQWLNSKSQVKKVFALHRSEGKNNDSCIERTFYSTVENKNIILLPINKTEVYSYEL